ncbi:MAG: SCO family protein [Myxococcota bacterium]
MVGFIATTGCRSDERASSGTQSSAGASAAHHSDDSDWRELFDRWKYPEPIPNFELTDQRGRQFRLHSLADRYVLLGFIYTRCPLPDACPLTTEKMRQVQRLWQKQPPKRSHGADPTASAPRLHLLSITLDPGYDTPAQLAQYAETREFDLDSWTLATGPEELVANALPSLFNVLALPNRGDSTIQHTVKVALLAPGMTLVEEWKDNRFEPADVLAAIAAAQKSSAPQ